MQDLSPPTDVATFSAVSKTFSSGTTALKDCTVSLPKGIVGLLGPNGAGKTTFISILSMALEASQGRVTVFGIDAALPLNRSRIRARLGVLPQHFRPPGALTPMEFLEIVARTRGISRPESTRRSGLLIELLGLSSVASIRCGSLSGGMTQRVGIAQALVHGPRLVILDEPTSGLDPEERMRLRRLLLRVADEATVLITTHIVEDIEAIASQLLIIREGRLLFNGDTQRFTRDHSRSLWLVPAMDDDLGRDAIVGRRLGPSGDACALVVSQEPPRNAISYRPRLEDAYAVFVRARLPKDS